MEGRKEGSVRGRACVGVVDLAVSPFPSCSPPRINGAPPLPFVSRLGGGFGGRGVAHAAVSQGRQGPRRPHRPRRPRAPPVTRSARWFRGFGRVSPAFFARRRRKFIVDIIFTVNRVEYDAFVPPSPDTPQALTHRWSKARSTLHAVRYFTKSPKMRNAAHHIQIYSLPITAGYRSAFLQNTRRHPPSLRRHPPSLASTRIHSSLS